MRRLLFVVLLTQCGGPRTKPEPHPLQSLEEDCEAQGFTGTSVLKRYPSFSGAHVSYAAIYRPGPMVTATMDIAVTTGTITCIPSYTPADSKTAQAASIKVPITVHFTTSDGLFDLTTSGTLWGFNGSNYGGSVDSYAPSSANHGTYKASLDRYQLAFDMGPDPGRLTGAALAERPTDPNAGNGFTVADFCTPVTNSSCQ